MKVNKIKTGSDEEPKMASSQMMKNAGLVISEHSQTNKRK
jgi:hypothetical protein